MGQQQIILLILLAVIVGIATITAIDTLQESRKNSNLDAVQQDVILILNEAQGYYFRNSAMNGGSRSFNDIQITDISIGDSTVNGTYSISGNGQSLVVEGNGVYEDVFLRANAELQEGDLQIEWEYE